MRGAPQVGFSTTIRKINSRTSFGVGFLPTRVPTLDLSFQYKRKPARCQRITVSICAHIRKTAMIFSLRSSHCLTAAFSQTNRWFCSASQSEFVTMEKPPIEDDAAREPLVCQENSGEGTDHPCWKMTADVESPFFLHSSESLREQVAISF